MQKTRNASLTEVSETVLHEETESHRVLPGAADSGLVLLCDHAENTLPPEYGTLGLPPDQLQRHIAYDIGAAEITRKLSERLNAPAVLSRFSRLLIDPNRGPDDPTMLMRISDGAVIPGNRTIVPDERSKRLSGYYDPYHDAIDRVIDTCLETGRAPALFSIHSFTHAWRGNPRPWHCAILWDSDPRLAVPVLEALRQHDGICVGDNEPYSGRLKGDCLWRHGTMRGLANCIVEVRQDLVRDQDGQDRWADRLASVLEGLFADPHFRTRAGQVESHQSPADINPKQT